MTTHARPGERLGRTAARLCLSPARVTQAFASAELADGGGVEPVAEPGRVRPGVVQEEVLGVPALA
ncbi:hypothetical protein [Microtetraspora malaysiensis]|uniref:Uncharacterized protein n=1 Tax=Microtetraspora malaysiensis TaxID=161358 RepID=A0ABW6T4D5_9ACTN